MTATRRHGIGMTSQRTRDRMVGRLEELGIKDQRVLAVIRATPRHLFVEEALASRAYEDTALPIGYGQTISQPYIVARMTELVLQTHRPQHVLEVGTGSGYQAAVLAQLVPRVYTVERISALLERSRRLLLDVGFGNIHFRLSDGSWGWPEKAPFDVIVLTAAPVTVPEELLAQLAPSGFLIGPVGPEGAQQLTIVRRENRRFVHQIIEPVSFVPLRRGLEA
ncbi:protein-L-isoaspartate(D-aspartate) O-methyltransferase [Acidihalobacter ferrooxydans]|uniref:Protein-L-isoaspartate O-methyltransferase n=1 Tax=Acidihalobacter ferrooxydans TaxID=1765967 RepID=A0A1P8UHX7_9GAMM|nr:protein-L-isoaspartate(D-aspartate) O-methyltransferase [Acidihalobacter ferrooxydans]APZ43440.1 protein-L-isoaspartate O-methyltransferase [Acidihalobacter ferrooxydans]